MSANCFCYRFCYVQEKVDREGKTTDHQKRAQTHNKFSLKQANKQTKERKEKEEKQDKKKKRKTVPKAVSR